MMAGASPFVVLSCEDSSGTAGSTVSRSEANKLLWALARAEDVKNKAMKEFSDERVEFSLMHSDGGGASQEAEAISEGPTFLICKGATDDEHILQIDERLRDILTAEELKSHQIKYQTKTSGTTDYWVSADTIRSRIESKRQRVEAPDAE
jgi:hypothetical protein